MAIYYVAGIPYGQTGELYHFGRKGMKWGQNIFTKFSQFAASRGWKGAATAAAKVSSGFRRANEYINRDQAKADFERAQRRYLANPNQSTLNALNAARASYNSAGLAGDMSRARERFGETQRKAAEAMANAREKVTTAYAKAASKFGETGRNIKQFYTDVMASAKQEIAKGAAMVKEYGGMAVNKIKELGKNALEGGRNFLTGILNRFRGNTEKATLMRSNAGGTRTVETERMKTKDGKNVGWEMTQEPMHSPKPKKKSQLATALDAYDEKYRKKHNIKY